MSFIRPEARAAIRRWRGVLIALVVLLTGLWWGLAASGIVGWVGYALIAIGAALLVTGGQRLRFRTGRGGPGVVTLDEGEITYFGPLTGGSVSLDDMTALSLNTTGKPRHWVLSQLGQPDLCIPLSAEGADILFDAFAALPGIQTEKMLSAMRSTGGHSIVIWQKRTDRLH